MMINYSLCYLCYLLFKNLFSVSTVPPSLLLSSHLPVKIDCAAQSVFEGDFGLVT
jgi:hypothetical protein